MVRHGDHGAVIFGLWFKSHSLYYFFKRNEQTLTWEMITGILNIYKISCVFVPNPKLASNNLGRSPPSSIPSDTAGCARQVAMTFLVSSNWIYAYIVTSSRFRSVILDRIQYRLPCSDFWGNQRPSLESLFPACNCFGYSFNWNPRFGAILYCTLYLLTYYCHV